MISKQQYERILEELHKFENPDITKEQYYTEPVIAGKLMHLAYMNHHIENKVILDLGCGTGFLGIGAMLNDAKKVIFVDIDNEALKLLKKNIAYIKDNYDVLLCDYEIINIDVNDLKLDTIKEKVDIVIMNPPFGLRNKDIDITFLEKAINYSDIVYMLQKSIRINQKISRFVKKFDLNMQKIDLDYKMKKQYASHKKNYKDMDFSIVLITK